MTGQEHHEDELVARYHEASADDPGRPGDRVGAAVRAHARMLVAEAGGAAQTRTSEAENDPAPVREAANAGRWKIPMVSSVLVIGLAGLLLLQFDRAPAPERDLVRGPTAESPRVPKASMADQAAREPPTSGLRRAAAPEQTQTQTQTPKQTPAPTQTPMQTPAPMQAPMTKAAPRSAVSAPGVPAPAAPTDSAPARQSAAAMASGASPLPADAMDTAPLAPAGTGGASTESMRRTEPSALGQRAAAASARAPAPAPAPGSESALHAIVRTGQLSQLQAALAAGAGLDTRDTAGRTPLMVAAIAGRAEMARRLLDAGANAALVDRDGQTAAQLARARGFDRIAGTIEDRN